MEFTRRLGQTQATTHFALPIDAPAHWKELSAGIWQTHIDLPDLPTKHIIIPSFALVGADFRFQFQLQHEQGANTLRPLPADTDAYLFALPNDNSSALSDHIDCWHTETAVKSPRLVLRTQSVAPPDHYVYVASLRPIDLEPSDTFAGIRQSPKPPAISQMAATEGIRKRICSPTALAMALGQLSEMSVSKQLEHFWLQLVEACYDPVTRAYGMWPQAIYQANRRGFLATVESNIDWQKVHHALEQQTPIVCSIRFAEGALDHAPMTQTSGHLVLLYGVNATEVLVMDPAAENSAGVGRVYDRKQFAAAWLTHRGAAYFFSRDANARQKLESQSRSN